MAATAQKDMSWKRALASPHRDKAIVALDKELSSLESTILTRIDPDDPEFEKAKELATPGRILLDIKRSGIYKARVQSG